MIKEDKELLFNIIKAGMLNKRLDLTSLEINSDLYRILKEQTFLPFLYFVSEDKRFNRSYIASHMLVNQFDKIGVIIKDLFDKEGIDHIFLKGFELRKLYPDPTLRLSGDIDVLVRESDYKKAKKILKENRFVFGDECEHHAGFKYGKLDVELHRLLIPSTEEYSAYFSMPFESAVKFNNHTYVFKNAYNFNYILAHYIKHLYAGAGLRELCDLYVMLEKIDINMDEVYVFLKEYKLEKFFDVVLSELKILFDYDKLEFTFNDYAYKLIDYSINAGIHGNGENNKRIACWANNQKDHKFVFLLKRLFLPVKTIFRLYPWTKSIILLPFGYVARFIHLVTKRSKWAKEVLKSKKENTLFKDIGLKD